MNFMFSCQEQTLVISSNLAFADNNDCEASKHRPTAKENSLVGHFPVRSWRCYITGGCCCCSLQGEQIKIFGVIMIMMVLMVTLCSTTLYKSGNN